MILKYESFIKEASIDYDGPITNKVKWFRNIFLDQMFSEGWTINWLCENEKFEIKILVSHISNMTNSQILECVKEYGWKFNKKGIITSFDESKLTRNRHLVTGNELGLL